MKKRVIIIVVLFISIILFLIYLGLSGGLTKTQYFSKLPELNYYHGIILNKEGTYVDSVRVSLLNSNLHSYTDENGYFELKGKSIDTQKLNTLVINKNGYFIDTLATFTFYHSDYKISEVYHFCRKEVDTITMIPFEVIEDESKKKKVKKAKPAPKKVVAVASKEEE